LTESPPETQAKEVTLGMMDGSKLHGRLKRFNPQLALLDLELPDGKTGRNSRQIAIGEVAFIGFNQRKSDAPEPPCLANMRKIKVHTVTAETFSVLVPRTLSHPVGFHGFPEEADMPFEHMFFYHHGVRAQEDSRPIGEILVSEHMVASSAIDQALKTQHNAREMPLGKILVEQQEIKDEDVQDALNKQKHVRQRLGDILLETGLIKQEDLNKALLNQSMQRGKKLGEILTELNLISEDVLISALAVKFNIPVVDLDEYPIDPIALAEIDESFILKNKTLPIATDERSLTIATSDPLTSDVFSNIGFKTNKRIHGVLATPSQLNKHLERLFKGSGDQEDDWLEIESAGEDSVDSGEDDDIQVLKDAKAAPVVRLANKIILTGLSLKASDIHLLPQEKNMTVAYRVDGALRQSSVIPKTVQPQVIARLKIISGMDIAEKRLPQDGRIRSKHEGGVVDFRVSCIPGVYGESIVIRILDKEVGIDLNTLGLKPEDNKRLTVLLRKHFGLILVTGPTGSGKSTTLFSILKELTPLPLHIISIENPVESHIPGVNQIQVNEKIGLSFASVLRNVLRHDPDVIMVGEIRDTETAKISVQAALTGHMMLSTLHTNTAADTIIRLEDIGVPAYLIAHALLAIISQNLVRRLCPKCRLPVKVSTESRDLILRMDMNEPPQLFAPSGCEQCNDSGFSGRALVYEFMDVTKHMRKAIHDGLTGQELQSVVEKEGMAPKSRHALELAEQGIISQDDLISLLI